MWTLVSLEGEWKSTTLFKQVKKQPLNRNAFGSPLNSSRFGPTSNQWEQFSVSCWFNSLNLENLLAWKLSWIAIEQKLDSFWRNHFFLLLISFFYLFFFEWLPPLKKCLASTWNEPQEAHWGPAWTAACNLQWVMFQLPPCYSILVRAGIMSCQGYRRERKYRRPHYRRWWSSFNKTAGKKMKHKWLSSRTITAH